jgi:hypothetical protein
MRNRFALSWSVLALVIALLLWAPTFVAAQAPSAVAAKTAARTDTKAAASPEKTWTLARTPDGQPDLQGYWTSLSFTPMERPAKYGGREFLTDEEMAQVFKEGVQHTYEYTYANSAETPVYDATVYALGAWQNGVKPNRRSSLVVDPPDGRIPPFTPEAAKQHEVMRKTAPPRGADLENGGVVKADVPADLGLGVRCLSFGGPPILPGAYDSNVHIVQGPGYVMVEYEWNSEIRIIPLDGRPHLSQNIRRWHGDSRGHWEGNTLVVETTNFRPGLDAATIEYKFTIDDPTTWTKPWSAVVPLNAVQGPMFEYACGEGNNGLVNIMAGARAAERTAAAQAASGGQK